eukprot:8896922-Alexandrium_andersonii.AAC.1
MERLGLGLQDSRPDHPHLVVEDDAARARDLLELGHQLLDVAVAPVPRNLVLLHVGSHGGRPVEAERVRAAVLQEDALGD